MTARHTIITIASVRLDERGVDISLPRHEWNHKVSDITSAPEFTSLFIKAFGSEDVPSVIQWVRLCNDIRRAVQQRRLVAITLGLSKGA